jgi:sacsin
MKLTRIEEHRASPLAADRVEDVIKLLNALPDDLDQESKLRIFMPDVDYIMHPISELYFNDTGIRITRLPLGQKAIAHNLLPEQLARKFGVEPMANHYSRFSGYMGESFVTSIRNAISEYTETQTLVEMLANAVDASARRFVLILDEMPQSTEHLISPTLRSFQQCPALLVFNDASFTEEDFDGLCNTGEGSKKQKDNTIGQFGRGALTMFHFTEVRV